LVGKIDVSNISFYLRTGRRRNRCTCGANGTLWFLGTTAENYIKSY